MKKKKSATEKDWKNNEKGKRKTEIEERNKKSKQMVAEKKRKESVKKKVNHTREINKKNVL